MRLKITRRRWREKLEVMPFMLAESGVTARPGCRHLTKINAP
jgi:hypothetical protein